MTPLLFLGWFFLFSIRKPYNKRSALGITESAFPYLLKLRQQVCQLESRDRCICALVAGLGACALDGLLDVLSGNHTERYRYAGLQIDLCDALGGLVAHEVVVTGRAADNRAEADNCIILAALRQLLCRKRNLKCTRNPYERDVIRVETINSLKRAPTIANLPLVATNLPSSTFILKSSFQYGEQIYCGAR